MAGRRTGLRVVAASVVAVAALVAALRACAGEEPAGPVGVRTGTAGSPASAAGAAPSHALQKVPRRRARTVADHATSALPADAKCVVRVRVTAAADGKPVAGAWVMVDDAGDTWPETATDASGTATFLHVTPGDGSVVARARGFVEASKNVTARADGEAQVELHLDPGAVVEVRVLDADTGAPVGGAEVDLASETGLAGDVVETDDDGRAVGLVSPECPLVASVTAAGYLRAGELVRSGPLDGTAVALVVRLVPAATLAGVVRTPDGEPLAESAAVRVSREGSPGVERIAESGEGGTYRVEGLVPGRAYVVTASAGRWSESEPVRVSATPDRRAMRADLVLRPATTVVVRTVDDDGEPLGGVTVEVESRDGNASASGDSAEQRFKVEPGPCRVRVKALDRVPARAERDVKAGETWDVTLPLSVGATISGVVVDADGAPLEGVRVEVPRGEGEAPSLDTTDEAGRFSLRALASGRHDVRMEGGLDFEDVVVPAVTAPAGGLRVVLPRRGRLRMQIELADPAADGADGFLEICGTGAEGRPVTGQHPLGKDGRVDVPWPHDAASAIVASAPGFAPAVRSASVPREGVCDIGPVRLVRGAAISGALRFAAGHAAAKVPLRVLQQAAPGRIVAATTAADGSFQIAGLLPGSAVIEAVPDDWPHGRYDVEVGSGEPLDLALPALGTLWVRVTAPDGGPEVGVEVAALGIDGKPYPSPWAQATTDDQGGAILRLGPGRVRIDVAGRVQTHADVRGDDMTVVHVRLP